MTVVAQPTPILHDAKGFAGMRKAGRLAAQVLDYIAPFVVPGVTTDHLNDLCHAFILDHDAIPAPLNYHGFPKSICTSVNQVVCHGIPGPKPLNKGDIINIDVTVIVDGWYGDTSRMFVLDPIPTQVQYLVDTTKEALDRAIDLVKPGCCLGDIGYCIQSFVERRGFSVVRDFCGHGIGKVFHTAPEVLHYGKPGTGLILQEGHFFTIEPMINMGKKDVKILKDGWTAETRDGKRSAQFEHTLGVTATGCEIFTRSDG